MLKHVVGNYSIKNKSSIPVDVAAIHKSTNKVEHLNGNKLHDHLNLVSNSIEETNKKTSKNVKKENHSNTMCNYLKWVGGAGLAGLGIFGMVGAIVLFQGESKINNINVDNNTSFPPTLGSHFGINSTNSFNAPTKSYNITTSTPHYDGYDNKTSTENNIKKTKVKKPINSELMYFDHNKIRIKYSFDKNLYSSTIKNVKDTLRKINEDFFKNKTMAIEKDNQLKKELTIKIYKNKSIYLDRHGRAKGNSGFFDENKIVTYINDRASTEAISCIYRSYLLEFYKKNL